MANAQYSFSQVVNGTGSFSVSGDTGYSAGVATLQKYLKEIGYAISDTSGRFQSSTKSAVEGFQYELGITKDGVAGPMTCLRLNTVHSSEYFNTYGKPLSSSEWGQSNILAGKFNDVDLLARIILAESVYTNQTDEKGVALVIKNRCDSGSSAYIASATTYPKASLYARVVGKSGQYSTANSDNEPARVPRRGYKGTEADGFIDPAWKKAIELANTIINGNRISVTGNKINGTTILTQTMTVNTTDNKNYLNQTAWSQYEQKVNNNAIDTNVQPLTFSTSKNANVIYKF